MDSGAVGCPDSSSFANVPKLSVCLAKVVVDNAWVGKISGELECLSKNSDFKNGMAYLCSKNQTELSIPYQKFTEMNAKVNAAFAAYKNATDAVSRQQASDDLEDAKRKRSMFGYENEVYQAMSAAGSGHEACSAKWKCLVGTLGGRQKREQWPLPVRLGPTGDLKEPLNPPGKVIMRGLPCEFDSWYASPAAL